MINIDVEDLNENMCKYLDLVVQHNEMITVNSNKVSAVLLSEKEYKRIIRILNNNKSKTQI